jgi:hypothetical protein
MYELCETDQYFDCWYAKKVGMNYKKSKNPNIINLVQTYKYEKW